MRSAPSRKEFLAQLLGLATAATLLAKRAARPAANSTAASLPGTPGRIRTEARAVARRPGLV